MKCEVLNLPGVGHALLCGPGSRRPRPCVAGCGRPGAYLCDHVTAAATRLARRRTCDAPLCATCRHHVAPNRDLCPSHAPRAAQGELAL